MSIKRIREVIMNQGDPSPSDAAKDQSRLLTNADIEALRGINGNIQAQLVNKQDILRSGSNIKTINNQSILGGGNLTISSETYWGDILGNIIDQTDLVLALDAKQNLLVNQVNIKSINGISLLGSGDIVIGGGSTPTLDQVTTAGNTTTNAITVGGLTVATNLIYTDTVNGLVGIGTTSPTAKLQIKGTGDNSVWITTEDFNGGTNTGSVIRIGTRSSTGNTAGWIDALNNGYSSYGNLMLNAFGGNVLIGTTIDNGYKLDVNGDTWTTRLYTGQAEVNTSLTVGNRIYLGPSGADTNVNYHIQSGGQVYIQANAFRADDFFTDLFLQSGTTQVSQVRIRGNDAGTGFISFDVQNAEAARFFAGGNFAIGTTTNNGYKLDVTGTIRATSTATVNYLNSSGGILIGVGSDIGVSNTGWRVKDAFGTSYFYHNTGPFLFHTTQFNIRSTALVTHFSADSIYTRIWGSSDTPLQINRTANLNAGIRFGNTGINSSTLYGGSDTYALRYFYNSSEFLTISTGGNVGIGTNTPQDYGSGYRVLHIGNASGASGLIKLTTGTSLDGPEIWTSSNNDLSFNTNGTFTRLFISGSSGNVGIGTNSPSASYKLDVNGDAKARFWDAHDASSITGFRLFGAGTFYGGLGLGAWSGTSGAATNDIVQVLASGANYHIGSGGAVKLTVTNSGNVGIGFNAASTRLGIVGGASVWNETTPGQTVGTVHLSAGNNTDQAGNALTFGAIDYLPTTTAQAGIYVKASGGYGTKMYFATTNSFATGSRTRMMIDNSGRVGINTTSPATLLNVNVGGSNANGTAGITVGGTSNYLSLEFGIEGGYDGMIRTYGNDLLLYAGHWRTVGSVSSENHNIKFYTSQAGSSNWSTPKMFLNHLGNLGIGTTSPSYKLQVEGTTYINSYLTVTDGTTGADMYADSIYGRGAMGLGSTIQPSGSNRHLRILTPTDGGAGQISIGYFKAGVGLSWNRALNISTAPAVPHLMLQPDSGNVVIGTTIDAGYKLNVNGDVNSTAYFINGVAGYTGMLVIPTNPPGQQNIDIQGGIIVNIF